MLRLQAERPSAENDFSPILKQEANFTETESKWNELKKDLGKSPRVNINSQSAAYMTNCDKLAKAKLAGSPQQNTNYNFFNYSINFSCEPIVVTENNKSMMNFGRTFDHRYLKESGSNSSLVETRENPFKIIGSSNIKPKPCIQTSKREMKESAQSYRTSQSASYPKNAYQIDIISTIPHPKDEKLLHMILEVKANLEGETSKTSRKRSETLQDNDNFMFNKIAYKKQNTQQKKEPTKNRNIMSPQVRKKKAKDEILIIPDDHSNIDTSYFKPIRDREKPMMSTNYQASIPKFKDRNTIGYKPANAYIDNSLSGNSIFEKMHKTFDSVNIKPLKLVLKNATSKPELKNPQSKNSSSENENDSEADFSIKVPNESRQPRLIHDSTIINENEDIPRTNFCTEKTDLVKSSPATARENNKKIIQPKLNKNQLPANITKIPSLKGKLQRKENPQIRNKKPALKTNVQAKIIRKK